MLTVPSLKTGVDVDGSGMTTVDITAKIQGSLLEDLESMGAEVSYLYRNTIIHATVSLDQVGNDRRPSTR